MTKQEVKEWLINDGQVPEGCDNNEYWNHWYDVISRMTQKQGQTFPLDSVTRCVLSDKDQAERKMLIDLQQDEDRWFSEDEFNRLLELNKKAFENHKALHGG